MHLGGWCFVARADDVANKEVGIVTDAAYIARYALNALQRSHPESISVSGAARTNADECS